METKTRTPMIIGGAFTALVALAALAGAAVLLWAYAARNHDGYLTTSTHRLHTSSRALVSPTVDLHTNLPRWLLGKVRVKATSGKRLFLGVARQQDVDTYLHGVSYSTVEDFDEWPFHVTYAEHQGTRVPAAPSHQTIWTATATDDLRWLLKKGEVAVVLMNADGSAGVDADVSFGARLALLLPVGIVLAVLGAALAALAALLISKGSRGRAL